MHTVQTLPGYVTEESIGCDLHVKVIELITSVRQLAPHLGIKCFVIFCAFPGEFKMLIAV